MANVTCRRKSNRVLGAGGRAGRTADHAQLWRCDYRQFLGIVEQIHLAPARGHAQSTTNATVGDNRGCPRDFGTRHVMSLRVVIGTHRILLKWMVVWVQPIRFQVVVVSDLVRAP